MLTTVEFRNAIQEAKDFAKAGQTNNALFDLAACLSILATNLEVELSDIRQRLQSLEQR